jgi:PAS domain S-box-containing protein
MNTLQAREALTFDVIPVKGNEKPRKYQNKISGSNSVFAVFSNHPKTQKKQGGKFLGLLSTDEGRQNPEREFLELLPSSRNGKCFTESSSLADVIDYMQVADVEAIPIIDEKENFLGIITQRSALRALAHQHQQLVTSHHKLKRAFRKLRTRNQVLYEQSPAMCWCLTKEGKILSVNRAAAKELGYQVKELLGQSVETVMAPEQFLLYKSYVRQSLKNPGEISSWETQKLRKDGSKLELRENVRVVEGAKGQKVLVVVSEENSAKMVSGSALENAEQQYRTTLDAIADMVLVKDRHSHLMWANKSFREYYGMTNAELEDLIDAPFNDPRNTEQYLKDDAYVVATGNTLHIPEEPVTCYDGTVRYFQTVKSPILDAHGRVFRLVAVCRDITEQKEAEVALNALNRQYNLILKSAGEGIYGLDKEGRITFINPAAAQMIGLPISEILGQVQHEVFSPSYSDGTSLPLRECAIYAAFRDGYVHKVDSEFFKKKDGTCFSVEYTSTPLRNDQGDLEGAVVVFRDVSDKRQTESVLEKSERRWRAIYDQAPTGIAIIDSYSGQFLDINMRYCDILGYSEEEMLAQNFQEITYPDDLQLDLDNMKRLLSGEIQTFQMVKRYIRKDGEIIWVALTCVPLWLEANEQRAHIAIVEDITQRKQNEEQIAEQNRLLTFDAEVGKIVSANQDLQPILQNCVEAMIRYLKGALARIWIMNEENGMLELKASAGLYTHLNGEHSRIPIGKWKIGKIAQDKKPMVSNSLKGDSRISNPQWVEKEGLVSFAGYPLLRNGNIAGILGLFSKEEMSSNMVKQLATLTEYLTVVMERSASISEVQALATQNQLLLNSAGDGIYGLDNEGKTTFVNPAAATMLGYGLEELIGIPMHQAIHHSKEDGSRYPEEECSIYAAMKDRKVYRGDNEVLWRKDGSHFPIEFISTPIWDQGNVMGSVVVFQDITNRLKTENELRNSEQWFRTLAESIPQHVWTARPDGAIDYVNGRALEYFGRKPEGLLEWNWQSFVYPEDLPACLEKWEKALQTGESYEIEFRLKRACDESYRWHIGRAEPLRNGLGEIVGWFGANTDITERKEIEKGLEKFAGQLQQRDRALISSIPDLILTYDERGTIVSMKPSKESEDIISEDATGKNIREVFPHDIASCMLRHIQTALDSPQMSTAEFDVWMSKKQRFFEARYVQSGEKEVLSLVRDVTSEKERISQMAVHAEELEQLVEERTETIKKLEAQRMQSEKLVALGQLAAGVAHEINNPLAGIKTAFVIMKEVIPKDHPDYYFVPLMDEAINRMSFIVGDMYKLYGSKTKKWEMVNLRTLIESVKTLLRSKWLDKNQQVTIVTAEANVKYILPEQELFQILANLIQNALDASSVGEEVVVEIKHKDRNVQIEVKDHGIGISPKLAPRIFEPFFSSKNKTNEPGMGLGLSVSRSLVEAIGGSLDFHSIPHKETVFCLVIPLKYS